MLCFSGTDGNSSPVGSPEEPGPQLYQGRLKQGRGGAGPVRMLGSDEANPPAGQHALAWRHRCSAENFFPDNLRVQPEEELCLALMLLPLAAAAAITPLCSGSRCCLRAGSCLRLAAGRPRRAGGSCRAKLGCDQRVTAGGAASSAGAEPLASVAGQTSVVLAHEMSGQVGVHASSGTAEVLQILWGGWKQHTSLCMVV